MVAAPTVVTKTQPSMDQNGAAKYVSPLWMKYWLIIGTCQR